VKERTQTGAKGPGRKSADTNHATMPSRNYAIISESHDWSGVAGTTGIARATNGNGTNGTAPHQIDGTISSHHSPEDDGEPEVANSGGFKIPSNPRLPLHQGENHAGTLHPAASGLTRSGLGGEFGLDVTIRVEISKEDREGRTEGYGITVPGLSCEGYGDEGSKW